MEETPAKQPVYEMAEEIIVDWYHGNNAHDIEGFDCDPVDLNLMMAYVKCLPPGVIRPTLNRLLTSPYLERELKDRTITFKDCVPTIHFREIKPPYEGEYNMIVQNNGLRDFILCDDSVMPLEDCYVNGGGLPVYICFIKIGTFFIVNCLPNPSRINLLNTL